MLHCTKCQTTKKPLPSRGTLILSHVDAEAASTIAKMLQEYRSDLLPMDEALFAVTLFDGGFEILVDLLRLLPGDLAKNGQYLLLEPNEELTFSRMTKMKPLSELIRSIQNAWVLEVIRENRLFCHYQPIVDAKQPSQIFAHECLMRAVGLDGQPISPVKILDAAEDEDLLFQLDRLTRLNAIAGFAEQNVPGKVFINFNPVSVYNPVACLQSTVAAAKAVGLTPDRIVFELIERSQVVDESHLLRIVDFYRAAGYGVALDDVGAGYSGLNLLSTLNPDYIKLDMHLIRDVDTDAIKQSIVKNLLGMAKDLGIRSIVEGVETLGEYKFALDAGADFVQGYYFAKPAAHALGNDLDSLAA